MRAPVSWIREYVDLPAEVSSEQLAARLTALGLKLESLEQAGGDITGPLVLGRVLSFDDEPQKNGKTIRWCQVDVGAANGSGEPQGIVCGASNFAVGDLVVVVLPGGVLPGAFEITARKTYGHVSVGDDLLHPRARASATSTTASWCCPPTRASPATTPSRCCTCATR